MKKVLLLIVALMMALAVQADMMSWNSYYLYANVPFGNPSGNGVDGYGWQTDIALSSSSALLDSLAPNAGTSSNLGWYDGSGDSTIGYYVGGFSFFAEDNQDVVMRIFNATNKASATHYLDSSVISLPDVPPLYPDPRSLEVRFDFTNSSWKAIVGILLEVYSEYGGYPVPPVGDRLYSTNAIVTCSVDYQVNENGTNFYCRGWLGTGDVPPTGSTNNTGPFSITRDSSITWLWGDLTNYWLVTSVEGNGTLNVQDGWQPVDTYVPIIAIPDDGWLFMSWAGDLSGDYTTQSTNLLMNGTKSITAIFSDDADADGLLNSEEDALGTNPRKSDTDDDLISDPLEVLNGLNPLVSNVDTDSDSDGLFDADEVLVLQTDPLDDDTDDDGFYDGFEVSVGWSPIADNSHFFDYIHTHGSTVGLYSSNSIMDLSMGCLMLELSNGWAVLTLQLEQSTNLVEGVWINAGDAVEWIGPATEGKSFFRVRGGP